jgi:hypothetical protein
LPGGVSGGLEAVELKETMPMRWPALVWTSCTKRDAASRASIILVRPGPEVPGSDMLPERSMMSMTSNGTVGPGGLARTVRTALAGQ